MMKQLKDKVVLLVDDDTRNTYALVHYLESLEMKVLVAENGKEAIGVLRGEAIPVLILLDMTMPVMDGYETLGILKQDEILKQIPVIAVTARAMSGDREKCIKAGAQDYISKPLDLKLLFNKINQWIL
jgi:CheY-like chemotaxis protein